MCSLSFFVAGPNEYPCSDATVMGSMVETGSRYAENTTCMLPAYLPASNYTVSFSLEGQDTGALFVVALTPSAFLCF